MGNHNHEKARGMAGVPLALGTGIGTAGQWSLSNLARIFPQAWAGSALLFFVGMAVVIACFRLPRAFTSFSLKIALIGLVVDQVLTLVLVWPVQQSAGVDYLGVWPYVLGTVATLIAGMVVGTLAVRSPLRHACVVASFDFLLAGASIFVIPYELTWTLVSRIVAGYCAVCLGALIGRYARSGWNDAALRREFFQKTTIACITAVLGAFVTIFLKEYLSLAL